MIPKHVGIIPDGNRRWAKKKGLHLGLSYSRGADSIFNAVEVFFESGVEFITIYIISLKNLSRSKNELRVLFSLLRKNLRRVEKFAIENKVEVVFCGHPEKLPEDLQQSLKDLEIKTKGGKFKLIGLVGYDGLDDFEQAIRTGKRQIPGWVPPMDLVVRTGGETRLSGFPPHLTTYSELYFTKLLWPDFTKEEVEKALDWFNKKERRFGK